MDVMEKNKSTPLEMLKRLKNMTSSKYWRALVVATSSRHIKGSAKYHSGYYN
jgi:hypothetical protein